MPTTSSPSIYASITDRIVAALESGVLPWHRPWRSELPCNAVSGNVYRGINSFVLNLAALEHHYESSKWLTFRQAQLLGGYVRKGERATAVVWWDSHARTCVADEDAEPESHTPRYWVARTHAVFNVGQVVGIDAESPPASTTQRMPAIEALAEILNAYGADIRQGGDRAYYCPVGDFIGIPPRSAFDSPEGYYGVLAHELIHHTGATTRLARDLSGRFATEAYAVEELVAEMGSAFVTGGLGIAHNTHASASYIASWLKVLRSDLRAVFTAARLAQEAADFILAAGRRPQASNCTEMVSVDDGVRVAGQRGALP
jgi:antirestriction protein ArdC